jgi:hypothetical protein
MHIHPAPHSQRVVNFEIDMAGEEVFTQCGLLHDLLVGTNAMPGPLLGEGHTYKSHEGAHGWDVRSLTHDWHTNGTVP